MLPNWVVGLVIGFVVRQIKKYGEDLNWSEVKADLDVALRASLPDFIEDAAVELAFGAVDIFKGVLLSDDLKAIAEKLLLGDVASALTILKDVILRLIHPTNPILAAKMVEACDEMACSKQV